MREYGQVGFVVFCWRELCVEDVLQGVEQEPVCDFI